MRVLIVIGAALILAGCMHPMTKLEIDNTIVGCATVGQNYEAWYDGPNDSQMFVRCVKPPKGINPYSYLSNAYHYEGKAP